MSQKVPERLLEEFDEKQYEKLDLWDLGRPLAVRDLQTIIAIFADMARLEVLRHKGNGLIYVGEK